MVARKTFAHPNGTYSYVCGNKNWLGSLEQSLNILAFGQAAQFCGGARFELAVSLPLAVSDLRVLIQTRFPLMPVNYMVAINMEYASNDRIIDDTSAEIAIIPPVSGG